MKRTNHLIFNLAAYLLIILQILSFSCNPKPHNFEQEKPKLPTGLKVRANPGLTFTVFYYVQNRETSFDGYNLYVTRESTGNTQLNNIYAPYSLNGSIPSLFYGSTDVNVDQALSFTVSNFVTYNTNSGSERNTLYLPFQPGVRYFFKITAHSNFDMESLPSNEVSAVAIP